ncbi:MAG: bifunctional ADP-dependent NAD(P)H-hydrate dehydratase/NAD(P)H-hydrate epimerase [Nocardioides sp.]|uniref:bifunctional ADP-dependent NAD(P)H-hydrate dehydratase/NAD(P)H-hydrate epimerase n=1 Tax=Nocardioides sp. TaxID=35761 RepID=UPI003F011C06
MRSAHTVEQVRAAEAGLMARLPPGTLMARAATGLAVAVADFLGTAYGRRVLLLVGSGDNGGDALYAGALLARRGARVEALLLAPAAHEGGVAALRAAGGRATRALDDLHPRADVLVDGIVGIGGKPGLRAEALAALAAYPGVPVVAVDVPSGVDVDTGETPEPHVQAALTVTFGTLKPAHLVDPAAHACGAVELVDIGLDLPPAGIEALQVDDLVRLLPRPGTYAHKYTRGVVGVRAGSATYPGAAVLSVAGASCGLVGMVRYVASTPDAEPVAAAVRQRFPEVVGDGRVQAWVVGPGGGEDAGAMLAAAVADGVPLVVDADALAHVHPGTLPAGSVLTPHAGELSAMLGVPRPEIEARGLAHARLAAETYGCVVLLKGRHTLVAHPGGRVRATTSGLPWLATAGAGDVLAGVLGALLAAGLDAFDAASVGSYLHGAAAAAASRGGPVVASDVAHEIPRLLRALDLGAGQSVS